MENERKEGMEGGNKRGGEREREKKKEEGGKEGKRGGRNYEVVYVYKKKKTIKLQVKSPCHVTVLNFLYVFSEPQLLFSTGSHKASSQCCVNY